MPRLIDFGALLGMAALVCAPGAAQGGLPSSRSDKPTYVERVAVHEAAGTGAAFTVEIETSGAPVSPDTQAITGPDRILVDFPGALPAAQLRGLKVNRGALKAIRTGLFFSNPPITRVVLDLEGPQSYRIAANGNTTVVTLSASAPASAKTNFAKTNSLKASSVNPNSAESGAEKSASNKQGPEKQSPGRQVTAKLVTAQSGSSKPVVVAPSPSAVVAVRTPQVAPAAARIRNASLEAGARVADTKDSPAVLVAPPQPVLEAVADGSQPALAVTFANRMLGIHAHKATLAQVLYEVQRQTQAEIAIPAGAEQEEVAADLGPAPAREVLSELLNGSPYNFIFVGNEESLERVILTRRDPGN